MNVLCRLGYEYLISFFTIFQTVSMAFFREWLLTQTVLLCNDSYFVLCMLSDKSISMCLSGNPGAHV